MENVVKLEVGQYWHHPTKGHEFIIEKVVNNCFESKCTRSSAAFRLDHNLRGFSENLKKNGYVLGRHPDNIETEWLTLADCKPCVGDVLEWKKGDSFEDWKVKEADAELVYFEHGTGLYLTATAKCFRVKSRAQPEQWQPKEGDLVWVKFLGIKIRFYCMSKSLPISNPLVGHNEVDTFPVPLSELEPYTNQDKPVIDFTVAGQWLYCSDYGIVKTYGDIDEFEQKCDSNSFAAIHFGAEFQELNTTWCEVACNWKLLTPEQMQPILDQVEKLKA